VPAGPVGVETGAGAATTAEGRGPVLAAGAGVDVDVVEATGGVGVDLGGFTGGEMGAVTGREDGAGVAAVPEDPAGPRGIGGGPEATAGAAGTGVGLEATGRVVVRRGSLRRSTWPGWIKKGSPMPFQRATSRQSRLLRKAMPYSVSPA
jgi:hypothetical protein